MSVFLDEMIVLQLRIRICVLLTLFQQIRSAPDGESGALLILYLVLEPWHLVLGTLYFVLSPFVLPLSLSPCGHGTEDEVLVCDS